MKDENKPVGAMFASSFFGRSWHNSLSDLAIYLVVFAFAAVVVVGSQARNRTRPKELIGSHPQVRRLKPRNPPFCF